MWTDDFTRKYAKVQAMAAVLDAMAPYVKKLIMMEPKAPARNSGECTPPAGGDRAH